MDEHRSNPFKRGPRSGGPNRPKRPAKPGERRPGLRSLPSDLNDLAEGRVDRLRRPRKAPEPLQEEHGGVAHVVPGVRNSDARLVYDRRVAALREAARRLSEGAEATALEDALCEAESLGLWRARNVTDFDAFAEHVVGVAPARARELADAGAARLAPNLPRPLPRELVALWVRTEAALLPVCSDAWVRVVPSAAGPQLELRLPANPVPRAVEALRGLGPALIGLAKLTGAGVEVPEQPPRRKR